LRVDVDEQNALLCDRKARSEIDSGGGLSDATFLVGNGECDGGHGSMGSWPHAKLRALGEGHH
jgi:hypothetical protein